MYQFVQNSDGSQYLDSYTVPKSPDFSAYNYLGFALIKQNEGFIIVGSLADSTATVFTNTMPSGFIHGLDGINSCVTNPASSHSSQEWS